MNQAEVGAIIRIITSGRTTLGGELKAGGAHDIRLDGTSKYSLQPDFVTIV
jgi:hypothetical protein